jgi:transporter family protein
MHSPRWLVYALCSALCAAVIPILAKAGMTDVYGKPVDSNLATVLRGIAFGVLLTIFGTAVNVWPKLHGVGPRPLFLILLTGVAGAASWLFYFNAIRLGPVYAVAAIDRLSLPISIILAVLILRDRLTPMNWVGVVVTVAGIYLAVFKPTPPPQQHGFPVLPKTAAEVRPES